MSYNTTDYEVDGSGFTNIQRSCGVLYFHFFWGLSMVILGWTAFAARWIDAIKPYHKRMGQIWVYGMIVQIYSSTYASYNGFRWFIFMFGVICYGSLIIGHALIRKLQQNKLNKLKETGSNDMGVPLVKYNETENTTLTTNSRTHSDTWLTQQRLKTLHGIFMFISLIMVTGAGAAFTSRFSSTTECKNIYCDPDSNGNIPDCIIK